MREALGFRESTVTDEQRWTRWLRDEVCPVELSEERVRDALLRRCRGDRIEPPGSSRIDRMLGAARAGHVAEFTARTVARLSDGANERLEQLVSEAADSAVGRRAGFLAELKADPGRVGLKTLLAEIEKLVSAPSGCRATCSRRRPSGSSRPGGHAPRSSIHRICAPLRVRSG